MSDFAARGQRPDLPLSAEERKKLLMERMLAAEVAKPKAPEDYTVGGWQDEGHRGNMEMVRSDRRVTILEALVAEGVTFSEAVDLLKDLPWVEDTVDPNKVRGDNLQKHLGLAKSRRP